MLLVVFAATAAHADLPTGCEEPAYVYLYILAVLAFAFLSILFSPPIPTGRGLWVELHDGWKNVIVVIVFYVFWFGLRAFAICAISLLFLILFFILQYVFL